MTASTQNANTYRSADSNKERSLGLIRSLMGEGGHNQLACGIPLTFGDSATVPTTAIDEDNDILRLMQLPAGAFILDFRGTISDCDTHATPAMVFSVVLTDSADSIQTTLVSASTNGQGGGSHRIADAAVGVFAGGQYLAIKTTTAAATPAAGTYKFVVQWSIGINTFASGHNVALTNPFA